MRAALGPAVDGRERDPPRRAAARAVRELRGRDRRRRLARVPRGAPGRAHRGRHRQQRRARPVRGRRQPPLRAVAIARRRGRARSTRSAPSGADDVEVAERVDGRAAEPHAIRSIAEIIGVYDLPVRPKLGWTDVARFAAHGIAGVQLRPRRSRARAHRGRAGRPRRPRRVPRACCGAFLGIA